MFMNCVLQLVIFCFDVLVFEYISSKSLEIGTEME